VVDELEEDFVITDRASSTITGVRSDANAPMGKPAPFCTTNFRAPRSDLILPK
jgi:hypothetical protein